MHLVRSDVGAEADLSKGGWGRGAFDVSRRGFLLVLPAGCATGSKHCALATMSGAWHRWNQPLGLLQSC